MKKVTSIVVLILCSFLSTAIIYLVSAYPAVFVQNYYGDNDIVAIALGCVTTFLIIKYLMYKLVKFPVNNSQKIGLSENGMRYKVWGAMTVAYFVANMIREVIQHTNHLVSYLFAGSLCALYGVLLFMQGGKVAAEHTANISIDTKDKTVTQVEPNKNSEALALKKQASSSTHIETSIPKDALMTLKELYDDGVLTEEEYNNKKKDLLGL